MVRQANEEEFDLSAAFSLPRMSLQAPHATDVNVMIVSYGVCSFDMAWLVDSLRFPPPTLSPSTNSCRVFAPVVLHAFSTHTATTSGCPRRSPVA